MFPGASATIHRNEAGEPTGWSYESYDEVYVEPEEEAAWSEAFAWSVCWTHGGWAASCPVSCWGDNLEHVDNLCCGPDGCCSGCCGTDEDRIRGAWHEGHFTFVDSLRTHYDVVGASL